MAIAFTDRAPITGTHRTADKYLAANARIARTGIQVYSGSEAGKPELASVRVYRSADEVFAPAAMASAAHKLRIPTEAGHGFRRDAGHRSGLKPATVPM